MRIFFSQVFDELQFPGEPPVPDIHGHRPLQGIKFLICIDHVDLAGFKWRIKERHLHTQPCENKRKRLEGIGFFYTCGFDRIANKFNRKAFPARSIFSERKKDEAFLVHTINNENGIGDFHSSEIIKIVCLKKMAVPGWCVGSKNNCDPLRNL